MIIILTALAAMNLTSKRELRDGLLPTRQRLHAERILILAAVITATRKAITTCRP